MATPDAVVSTTNGVGSATSTRRSLTPVQILRALAAVSEGWVYAQATLAPSNTPTRAIGAIVVLQAAVLKALTLPAVSSTVVVGVALVAPKRPIRRRALHALPRAATRPRQARLAPVREAPAPEEAKAIKPVRGAGPLIPAPYSVRQTPNVDRRSGAAVAPPRAEGPVIVQTPSQAAQRAASVAAVLSAKRKTRRPASPFPAVVLGALRFRSRSGQALAINGFDTRAGPPADARSSSSFAPKPSELARLSSAALPNVAVAGAAPSASAGSSTKAVAIPSLKAVPIPLGLTRAPALAALRLPSAERVAALVPRLAGGAPSLVDHGLPDVSEAASL